MPTPETHTTATITQIIQLLPTPAQEQFFFAQGRASKKTWNASLTWHQQRAAAGIAFLKHAATKNLTLLKQTKPTYRWFNSVPASCTHDATTDLDKAFAAESVETRIKKPKYKSHPVDSSHRVTFGASWLKFSSSFRSVKMVKCPGPGSYVRLKLKKGQRLNAGCLKHHNCTIVYDELTKRWHLHIPADVPVWWLRKYRCYAKLDASLVAGFKGEDVGLTTFSTLVDDFGSSSIANPRFFRDAEEQLAGLQRKKSGKKKYSKRYTKLGARIAKVHRKVKNRRKQFHHDEINAVLPTAKVHGAESLCVTGLKRMKNMGKSVSDAGWSQYLRIKEAVAVRYGVEFYKVPRNFPSSKLCSVPGCGFVWKKLPLKIREWTCPKCGTFHDREINAATNVRSVRADDALSARWIRPKRRPKSYGSFADMHARKAQRAADTRPDCAPGEVPGTACSGAVAVSVETGAKAAAETVAPLSEKTSKLESRATAARANRKQCTGCASQLLEIRSTLDSL